MNKFLLGLITAVSVSAGVNAFADTTKECEKLKDDYNIIYASKGFCFKDPDTKAKFGNENCNTTKPKFSEKEQQKLDSIKQRQKELNCK
ncbi:MULTISPECIES: YARHG domain-containing protein [unclassified Acinetobacter]|uniref:YARHG domain-containing protein n=1 Tax=unclassified Acinetobacter TaxID=196816 RepID=UPI00044C2CE8|nr:MULTISPECIES: YARHG domain-containing protein [unclassified Acinetobacter]EZQ10456.1 signal peptide protein [Acinetobacter sp. Ver3]SEM24228.1 YARHG domain-containing protein [Acinetobacter sp. DSM 11652]